MATTFADTGAFVALAVGTDERHAAAQRSYDDLLGQGARLITTNHVVDETCTWLLRRVTNGHQAALTFGVSVARASAAVGLTQCREAIRCPGVLVVCYATPEIERAAWDIFGRYDAAGFSFTDCVSFAVMQSLGIKKAFTFDEHYDMLGFERL